MNGFRLTSAPADGVANQRIVLYDNVQLAASLSRCLGIERMRRIGSFSLILTVALLAASAPVCAAYDALNDEYAEALQANGFSDLAVDLLERELARPGLSADRKADLEFAIASALVNAATSEGDLSRRDQRLEEARKRFDAFVRTYPNHPKQAESLIQGATIDLQKGRLRVVQAQLPANSGRTVALANEAREYLNKALSAYDKAQARLFELHKQMPPFIPEDDHETRRKKTRLFHLYIEARFQTALTRFYLADSYKSIEPGPPPAAGAELGAKGAHHQLRIDWEAEYIKNIEEARKGFEAIFADFRREYAGLYGHLWMARCLAAQSEFRKARGIFENLLAQTDPALAAMQRDVFYFMILSFTHEKDYEQVINRSTEWMKKAARFNRDSAFLGVQLEVAKAHIALGLAADDDKVRDPHLQTANRLLDRLGGMVSEFTGLARREQMRLAGHLEQGPAGRSFNQLVSLATAKLDSVKPDMPETERRAILTEAEKMFRKALSSVKPTDEMAQVNHAYLLLCYTYLQAQKVFEAAVLAEFLLRYFPKSEVAPQAALFGSIAYAADFEQSSALAKLGVKSATEIPAERLNRLADLALERWPNSKETGDILLTIGRIELGRKRHAEALAAFEKVAEKSARGDEALSLAGLTCWEWYKLASKAPSSDADANKQLRAKAIDRLGRASKPLRDLGNFDRRSVVNDAMLAEARYDAGEAQQALDLLIPLVEAIRVGKAPATIEPSLRLNLLTTALQSCIRSGKLDQTDALVELISAQKGQEQAANITQVFLALASRMKEQLDRQKAADDTQALQQTTAAYEAFLERLGNREIGQTVQSLVFIAGSFLDLGKHERALELLKKASQHPNAGDDGNRPSMLRARLLTARCYSAQGEHKLARATIDRLLTDNPNIPEAMVARGDILEAAGDQPAAKGHWAWTIKRLQQARPKRPEYYVALDRIIVLFKNAKGAGRIEGLKTGQKYAFFLLNNDPSLPAELRPVFERHLKEIEAELGETK